MATLITLLDMTTKNRGSAHLDRLHDALNRGQQRTMELAKAFSVPAEDVRHFQFCPAHWPGDQKCFGGSGFGSTGTGRGNKSRGLVVEQTLLVAILRYRAVVAKLR